jgi:hypothetical protein
LNQQPNGVQKASLSKRKKARQTSPQSMPVEAIQAVLGINIVMMHALGTHMEALVHFF